MRPHVNAFVGADNVRDRNGTATPIDDDQGDSRSSPPCPEAHANVWPIAENAGQTVPPGINVDKRAMSSTSSPKQHDRVVGIESNSDMDASRR